MYNDHPLTIDARSLWYLHVHLVSSLIPNVLSGQLQSTDYVEYVLAGLPQDLVAWQPVALHALEQQTAACNPQPPSSLLRFFTSFFAHFLLLLAALTFLREP